MPLNTSQSYQKPSFSELLVVLNICHAYSGIQKFIGGNKSSAVSSENLCRLSEGIAAKQPRHRWNMEVLKAAEFICILVSVTRNGLRIHKRAQVRFH